MNKLVSLQSQVKTLGSQDKSGKQNFHEDLRKVFETVTDTSENTSEDLTKAMMLTSKEKIKALTTLNDKLLRNNE